MPFKKNITPLGKKSRIDMQRGKGSIMQRNAPRQQETLTGGDPMLRAANRYPAAPQPPPNVAGAAPVLGAGPPQPGGSIGPQPTAGMPQQGPPDIPV